MSFYGTVFYEFEQVFFKFQFKNSESDSVTIEPKDSVNGTTANVRWDTLNFNSGNRWIGMSSEEDSTSKGVTLYHAAAGPTTHSIETLTIPTSGDKGTQLSAGQNIEIPKINYDNAGHIVDSENIRFTLPAADTIVEEGMEDHFETSNIISVINPASTGSVSQENVLKPGQIITAPKFNVTEKGVVSGVEQIYYQLPQSDAEQNYNEVTERLDKIDEYLELNDINDIRLRVDKVEKDILENETDIETKLSTTDKKFVDEIARIDKNYAPLTLTGKEAPKGYETFAAAIGNIQNSAKTMSQATAGLVSENANIAQQFEALVTYAGLLYWELGMIKNKVSTLEDRIAALEK